MIEELTLVSFRSAETGQYLFHAKYPTQELRHWELAAAALGVSLEEFVQQAINEALERYSSLLDSPTP